MKKVIRTAVLALFMSAAIVSCKKKVSDAELTTGATTVIRSYPNATVEVKEGTAHLSGTFATDAQKEEAIASLKKVEGIKEVHDMATVEAQQSAAPIEVQEVDAAVLQQVNDALKDIPGVKAENINGVLTLTGETTAQNARKVKESVDALNIGRYENKIVVK